MICVTHFTVLFILTLRNNIHCSFFVSLDQMLVCTLDGDLYPPLEEPTGTDPKSKKKDKDKDKKFVWNHGSK